MNSQLNLDQLSQSDIALSKPYEQLQQALQQIYKLREQQIKLKREIAQLHSNGMKDLVVAFKENQEGIEQKNQLQKRRIQLKTVLQVAKEIDQTARIKRILEEELNAIKKSH